MAKAADMSSPKGMFHYSLFLQNGDGITQDNIAALAMYERGVRAGSSSCAFNLAVYFENGTLGVVDTVCILVLVLFNA